MLEIDPDADGASYSPCNSDAATNTADVALAISGRETSSETSPPPACASDDLTFQAQAKTAFLSEDNPAESLGVDDSGGETGTP